MLRQMLKKLLSLLLLFSALHARECCPPVPLLSLGTGRWLAGGHHTTWLFQAEYKWGTKWLQIFRPFATFITPSLNSAYGGAGVSLDLYAFDDRIVFSPSFCPGIYIKGKGKNLGYPIEFRSSFEVAYEFENHVRLGTQFWHISNASLGKKNPGVNAWTVFLAFPLNYCY